MPRRKTQEQFEKEIIDITNGEYIVISKYTNAKKNVTFLHINCNNTLETAPDSFLSKGTRCQHCKIDGHTKTHEQFVKEVEDKFGKGKYKFLTIYIDSKNPVKLLHIACGRYWDVFPSNLLKRDVECPYCKKENSMKERHLKFLSILKQNGFTYVNGEYINEDSKYKVVCPNKHLCNVTYESFVYKHSRCQKCYLETIGDKKRNDFELVFNIFSEEGYFIVGEYINRDTPMEIICPNNHAWMSSLNNFNQGHRCPTCKKEKVYTLEEAKEEFTKYNLIPMFNAVYDKDDPLPFICPKHRDLGLQYTSLRKLKRIDYRCSQCYERKYKGENHFYWKGGISNVSEYLRNTLYSNWKYPSLKKYNFKCAITNTHSGDLEVHHLYKNFSEIIKEVFENLDVEIKQNIGEYEEKVLIAIKNMCLELHLGYGLGVPLRRDIHKLFHQIYGVQNNNKNQFEEFQTRWNNGEFETLFDDNYSLINKLKSKKD